MSETRTPYPLHAVRTLALHAQGLAAPPGTEPSPTPDAIYSTVEQLGCVQIDTLQMVRRSQYLVLWSRLGRYDPADLDRLIHSAPHRRLFEYWLHAASIIPLTLYRYRLPVMRRFREGEHHWNKQWLRQAENRDLVAAVLQRVREEGPLRAANFQHDGQKRGPWWDWKPAKRALEVLYDEGRLMIADRVNFQRVYDLAERVLPDWVDATEPAPNEMKRFLLERSIRALGICHPLQAAEYAYLKRTEARPYVEALVAEGVAVEVEAELADGQTGTLIVHRHNLPWLEQAADGALRAERTTFLSPFDSLFWARDRDMQFWGFRQALEAYKPAAQREYGYFCLPILHRDRLVGRFDPRLERKTGILHLRAFYLEPGISPDDALVADVAGAMRDFLAFHDATALSIERSDPPEFGPRLLAAL